MRINLVVAFLTALCLAVVGGSAGLGAKPKKPQGNFGDPIHFVFRDASSPAPADRIGSDDRGIYSDGDDGGKADISPLGTFRFRPGSIKGKNKNQELGLRKVFFDFTDQLLVPRGSGGFPDSIALLAVLVAGGSNKDDRLCTESLVDLPDINDCVPEGLLRGLGTGQKGNGQAYYGRFHATLPVDGDRTTDQFFLDFKTDVFFRTDYVTVTCKENRDPSSDRTCTKWTIEGVDDTGGKQDDDENPITDEIKAVARLGNATTDTLTGYFRMPFEITACLKEFYSKDGFELPQCE